MKKNTAQCAALCTCMRTCVWAIAAWAPAAFAQVYQPAAALNNGGGAMAGSGFSMLASIGDSVAGATARGGELTFHFGLLPVVLSVASQGPLNLRAVVSRKLHGSVGTFNLKVSHGAPIAGDITIEPRAAGTGHLIVFEFDAPVTAPGTVIVTGPENEAVGSATVAANGNAVHVTLVSLPAAQRVTISLTGVNGATAAQANIGFLIGDFNASRNVNHADVSAVKARSGQLASEETFRFDVNTSGRIGAADIAATKAKSGSILP